MIEFKIKPLTIYELDNKIDEEIIKFKTSNNAKETIILKATKYKVGEIHSALRWHWPAFKQSKPKINHLPKWF